ncbi:MAG: ExbD/TolR family protein [Thermoguttaceae bacterium]
MPLKTHVDEDPSINLTPMVDVVFQLILFFLLGTKFTEMERKIGLEIPRIAQSSSLPAASDRQVLNVYRDGSLSLDGVPVTLEELVWRLAARRSGSAELGILVRGDAKGQFQRVAEVLNACKQAGIQELGISVLPVPGEK